MLMVECELGTQKAGHEQGAATGGGKGGQSPPRGTQKAHKLQGNMRRFWRRIVLPPWLHRPTFDVVYARVGGWVKTNMRRPWRRIVHTPWLHRPSYIAQELELCWGCVLLYWHFVLDLKNLIEIAVFHCSFNNEIKAVE